MGFLELRQQFGKHVGVQFAEERPSVGIPSKVLSEVFGPAGQGMHGMSQEVGHDHEQSL